MISYKKNYILIILVDFYVSLSRFFLLLGSGSTFPEVDPAPDPAKWYWSNRIRIQIRIRIRNTGFPYIFLPFNIWSHIYGRRIKNDLFPPVFFYYFISGQFSSFCFITSNKAPSTQYTCWVFRKHILLHSIFLLIFLHNTHRYFSC